MIFRRKSHLYRCPSHSTDRAFHGAIIMILLRSLILSFLSFAATPTKWSCWPPPACGTASRLWKRVSGQVRPPRCLCRGTFLNGTAVFSHNSETTSGTVSVQR
ncbi:hypothetical protein BDQ94DRAFT_138425 [Aspergillus welwitschiae]|uniref:Uncharacterized protein n=1 Tax=Aspergillus welwitschiae TaxID=1341132 RepID=A0A3F3QC77_9EURO|nr:hypothetical protein BDQ94DRAFT_138425 [Aspergillus welwitschiae]RDH36803.1 hypothetical protein BDQ94DRAFT_138425 [Aspergillus welwitschiae]